MYIRWEEAKILRVLKEGFITNFGDFMRRRCEYKKGISLSLLEIASSDGPLVGA